MVRVASIFLFMILDYGFQSRSSIKKFYENKGAHTPTDKYFEYIQGGNYFSFESDFQIFIELFEQNTYKSAKADQK